MRIILFLVSLYTVPVYSCFSPLLHDNGAPVEVTISTKQYRAGLLEYAPQTSNSFGKYILALQNSANELLYVLDNTQQHIFNTSELDQVFLKSAYGYIQTISKKKEADTYYTSQAPKDVLTQLTLANKIIATCAKQQLHFRPWLFFDVMGITEEYFNVVTDKGARLNQFPIPEMLHFDTLVQDFPGRAGLVPRSSFKKYDAAQLRTLVATKNKATAPGAVRLYKVKGANADIRSIINDVKNDDACFHITCDASHSVCLDGSDYAQEIQLATLGATILRKYYMHEVMAGNVLIQSNVPVTSGYADFVSSKAKDPGLEYCLTYNLITPAVRMSIYNGLATKNQKIHLIMAQLPLDALYAAYFLGKKTVWLDISQSTVTDLVTLLQNEDLKKLILQAGLDVVINISSGSITTQEQVTLANVVKTFNKDIALRAQATAPGDQKKSTIPDHVIIMKQGSQSLSTNSVQQSVSSITTMPAKVPHHELITTVTYTLIDTVTTPTVGTTSIVTGSLQQKKLSAPVFTPTILPDGSNITVSTTAASIVLGIIEYAVNKSPVYLGVGSAPDNSYIVPSYKGDASAIPFPLTDGYLLATDESGKQAIEALEGAAAGGNAQVFAGWTQELLTPALADTIDPTGNLKNVVFVDKEA